MPRSFGSTASIVLAALSMALPDVHAQPPDAPGGSVTQAAPVDSAGLGARLVAISSVPNRADFPKLLQMAALLAKNDSALSARVAGLQQHAARIESLAQADPRIALRYDMLGEARADVAAFVAAAAGGDATKQASIQRIAAGVVDTPLGVEAQGTGADLKRIRADLWTRYRQHEPGAREVYRVLAAPTLVAADKALKADQDADARKAADAGPSPMASLITAALLVGLAAETSGAGGHSSGGGGSSEGTGLHQVCEDVTVKDPDQHVWVADFQDVWVDGGSHTEHECHMQ